MTTHTAPAPDEHALVAAAQSGDERAFRALVEPHARALEVHCYRMLGSAHDAEDVAQETLLRAWRALDRFQRRASVQTWLYRIATNACLDELERRPRRPAPVDPYPDEWRADAVAPVADPAARYALREGMELAFLTAIQRLPGRQRAVLILRDVLGWTGAETAELLQTTVAAVNSALQRARATIEAEAPARSAVPGRATERSLLRRYVEAWEHADMEALVTLLREDAVLTMPPEPSVTGAAAIVAFFTRAGGCAVHVPEASWVNGRPAVVLRERRGDGSLQPHRLLVLDVEGDGPSARVAALHAFRDPADRRPTTADDRGAAA
jgi:RNA polymerase sigma-70 factor (ECF subfamily)